MVEGLGDRLWGYGAELRDKLREGGQAHLVDLLDAGLREIEGAEDGERRRRLPV